MTSINTDASGGIAFHGNWMHSGGGAVQIGYPADLSGNPCRNDEILRHPA